MCSDKINHAPPWCPPSPVGLYKVTKSTTWGFSIGATPQNDETYLFTGTIPYWTMSPGVFDGGYAGVVSGDRGAIGGDYVSYSGNGVRPVISLSSSAITGGTGTSTDPFVVSWFYAK